MNKDIKEKCPRCGSSRLTWMKTSSKEKHLAIVNDNQEDILMCQECFLVIKDKKGRKIGTTLGLKIGI